MKNNIDIFKKCPLFDKVQAEDISLILTCLDVKCREYNKNDFVIFTGDRMDFVGIVKSGSVKIVREDVDGNQLMVGEAVAGEMFGEVFACADIDHSPVSVIAKEKTEIMFFSYKKVITTCCNSCRFHNQLIENMMKIIARKNIYLNQKINIISKKSLRDKILTYLEYAGNGDKKVTINLNREDLANYLCADRSALSNVLSKMQRDGVIRFSKNYFEILD